MLKVWTWLFEVINQCPRFHSIEVLRFPDYCRSSNEVSLNSDQRQSTWIGPIFKNLLLYVYGIHTKPSDTVALFFYKCLPKLASSSFITMKKQSLCLDTLILHVQRKIPNIKPEFGSRTVATWTTTTRTTATGTTATQDNCHPRTATWDNCHPGQLPPRKLTPRTTDT